MRQELNGENAERRVRRKTEGYEARANLSVLPLRSTDDVSRPMRPAKRRCGFSVDENVSMVRQIKLHDLGVEQDPHRRVRHARRGDIAASRGGRGIRSAHKYGRRFVRYLALERGRRVLKPCH